MKPGIYRHYKGKLYEVHGLAVRSGHEEEDPPSRGSLVVVYTPMYNREGGAAPLLTWRTLEEWKEEVQWPDGQRRARFVRESSTP